jgi:hypothetical protein
MKLAPFLLDQWLKQKFSADPAIEFDLGSSTGPVWTLRELLDLGGSLEGLLDTKLFYNRLKARTNCARNLPGWKTSSRSMCL